MDGQTTSAQNQAPRSTQPEPSSVVIPFINTHKAAVIIKYKKYTKYSTMNRKIYKRNKIKMNERVLPVIKAVQIEHTTNE